MAASVIDSLGVKRPASFRPPADTLDLAPLLRFITSHGAAPLGRDLPLCVACSSVETRNHSRFRPPCS